MCGRTACTLNPEQLCRACALPTDQVGKLRCPFWKEHPGNDGGVYQPSFNIAPSAYCPVLVEGSVLDGESGTHVLQPMRWGLVPSWHKGLPEDFQYKMVNARAETIEEKTSYRIPVSKGQRCVVVADGFFEWDKRNKKEKQPYFFYFPQAKGLDWSRPEKDGGDDLKGQAWSGRRLLTMAGLFDCNQQNDNIVYSYSVITVDAAPSVAWCHDRMPAILPDPSAVLQWLDPETTVEEAMSLLTPYNGLEYHPVSNVVNSARFQGSECVLAVAPSPSKITPKKKRDPQEGAIWKYFKPTPSPRSRGKGDEQVDPDDEVDVPDGEGPSTQTSRSKRRSSRSPDEKKPKVERNLFKN